MRKVTSAGMGTLVFVSTCIEITVQRWTNTCCIVIYRRKHLGKHKESTLPNVLKSIYHDWSFKLVLLVDKICIYLIFFYILLLISLYFRLRNLTLHHLKHQREWKGFRKKWIWLQVVYYLSNLLERTKSSIFLPTFCITLSAWRIYILKYTRSVESDESHVKDSKITSRSQTLIERLDFHRKDTNYLILCLFRNGECN